MHVLDRCPFTGQPVWPHVARVTSGGYSRCLRFSDFRCLSFTPPGRHSRAITTALVLICRRFILRKFWAMRRMPGSAHGRTGGRRWAPASAALLILWAPGGFRLTCYYYRGAYYKAFWADPPSCTVGEPRKSYRGERSFPLILQNVHRYFLYLALIFLLSFSRSTSGARSGLSIPVPAATHLGIGVGTLVLALNVVLLGGYTFGCHSLRHLVGDGWMKSQNRRSAARHITAPAA